MRCKSCNYPLWNLPDRVCPECGAPFKPSDFEFVPSAVRFCCRGCMQPYYGTTWRGHLDPVEFGCVRCGAHVHMDETVLVPTEGVHEDRTLQGANPWLDQRRGFLGRFFAGIGHAMVKPTAMARGTPMDSGLGKAAGFAMLVNVAAYSLCWAPQLALSLVGGAGMLGGTLVLVGGSVVAATVGLWVWGLLAHLMLKLTGATSGTLRHTFLALYYSAGANIMSGVFCAGFLFGWIWWVVSACLMLREMQRVSGVRAAAAVILPVLLGAGTVVGGYAYVISTTMSRIAARGGTTWTTPGVTPGAPGFGQAGASEQGVADAIGPALVAAAGVDGGRLPAHPADLVARKFVPASAFVARGTGSTELTAMVGGRTLQELDLLPPGERLEAFRQAMRGDEAGADAGATALRLGDVVLLSVAPLTLEGAAGAGLWIAVVCADPDRTGPGANAGGIWVIDASGAAQLVASSRVAGEVGAQNEARTAAGLGAIEDPRGVRHRQPGGG